MRKKRRRNPFWRSRAAAEGRRLRVVLLCGLMALAGGTHHAVSQAPDAQDQDTGATEAAPEEAAPEIAYEVEFEGVPTEALRDLLGEVSETRRLIDDPPSSLARLRRRAENDREVFVRALRSRGYYASSTEVRLDREAEPVRVIFDVEAGPVYRLGDLEIELAEPAPELDLPALAELGLEPGAPAESEAILGAESTLLERVETQGYALAELGERTAIVDHDTQTMDLTLRLDPGPRTRFGEIEIIGLTGVEEDYVRGRLPWERGEPITPERLSQGRVDLLETRLFSTVRIRLGDQPDAEGRLPVTVEVSERKHRSIGVGVRFRTDEGPGGSVSWEHRNAFGAGERTELEFDASGIGLELTGDFRKPDFRRRDQALVARSEIANLTTDAFNSRSARAEIGVERELAPPGMTAALGVAFKVSEVEDDDADTFGLVSLPGAFNWDRSNDLLDPTEGGRLAIDNEPFADTFGSGLVFNRTRIGYRHYLTLFDEPQLVLAGRGVLGTLFGAERDDVPADERFYAGGGGSVRGFGFQLAGELDDDDDPVGGRSLLEFSGELRLRLTESFGAVAFVDAGSAFESQVPDFDEELRVGVGTGVRYFSPIGPLRVDVAFPLNKRDVDDSFQIYISLGQAF